MFYIDIYYIVLIVPTIILSLIAQVKVSSTFNKYSTIRNSKGLTGAQVARRILDANGLTHVAVKPINGNLTDNYNPLDKTVNLSESVYNSTSVAALGVAAHESGHAVQHATSYGPLSFRTAIFPVVRISSAAAIPLAMLGFIFGFEPLVSIGIILFAAVVLFHVITLPVEFNASRRAIYVLENYGILTPEENSGAKKVLSAAAMTYLASALTAIANLIRLILISRED